MLELIVAAALASSPKEFKAWGIETLDQIHADFYLPDKKLYAEQIADGKPAGPSFCWSSGVMLSALAAGAKVERKFKPWLRDYADAMHEHYWNKEEPVAGFDVQPLPKQRDRYYDDNAWMGLALLDTYEVLKDKKYLEWAEETYKFVKSGEDNNLGGGIYWKENEKNYKNACSTAPTVVLALRLFEHTRKKERIADARRLWEWTKSHLQDADDRLFWDKIRITGGIDKTKWTYNTGLMIRGAMLLRHYTKERFYSIAGVTMGDGALKQWFRDPNPDDKVPQRVIADEAAFAHLLAEAFITVPPGQEDHYLLKWDAEVSLVLQTLHGTMRDANGHYGPRWDATPTEPYKTIKLIDQAAAARAYFVAAANIAEKPAKPPIKRGG